jgi:hypothetical protein
MREILVQKLTSRKLWVAIVGIVVGLATAFGIDENEYVQVAGAIGSICSAIVYILGEASIDKASAGNGAICEPVETIEGEDLND